VLNDLVTVGRVRRPSLGVRTLPVGPELAAELRLATPSGVLIVQVLRGGAADRAGLRGGTERVYLGNVPILAGGDVIVAMDGDPVVDQGDIARIMNRRRAGDSVKVTVFRGAQKMDFNVVLGEAQDLR